MKARTSDKTFSDFLRSTALEFTCFGALLGVIVGVVGTLGVLAVLS